MEDTEIINLWKSYGKKLDENLLLNRKNAEAITKMKVQSLLSSMKPLKIFIMLGGVVWVCFVDSLIINLFHKASLFFLVSAGIQVLLTQLAIGIYLYQLILINRVNVSEPVLATQEKLSRLKSSTLWVARLLFLQLPLWTTYYLSGSMLERGNVWLYTLQIIVTLLFTYLAIWLFLNIKYANRDKNWFRLIFPGKILQPVIKSIELLNQIDEYKIENKAVNENASD